MIGSLRGLLLHRSAAGEVLVEVGGVGYRVTVAPTTAVQIGEVGAEVFLWVHHHSREADQSLFGFATLDERACFEALLGAHGVGPALALAILSVHPPAALAQVLADEDVAALCLVPGVGKKTAARLLIELASRIDVATLGGGASSHGSADDPAVGGAPGVGGRASRHGGGDRRSAAAARADVRDALAGLGYSPDEIRDVLRDLPDPADVADSSALLREALQRLAVARR